MTPRDRFTELLTRLAQRVCAIERDEVCCGGLTPRQFETLRSIERDGPAPVGVLAERLGIDVSTASRNVALLERDGHASRTRADDDGRVVRIALTKKGARALETLCCDEGAALASLYARLPRDRRAAVVDALEVLDRSFDARAQPAPACCQPPRPSATKETPS